MEVLKHKPNDIHCLDDVCLQKDLSHVEVIEEEKEPGDNPEFIKSLQIHFPQYKKLFNRKETLTEILKNFGTNIRYKVEFISQEYLWKPDLSQCQKVVLMGENLLPKYARLTSKEITDKIEHRLSDIIWFSYRRNFPKLLANPEDEKLDNQHTVSDQGGFVSDTGWGCMIRACQMTYGECLRRLKGQENIEERDRQIISWFLDRQREPTLSPYSIQTLSRYLKNLFLVNPGTWLKPSTVLLSLSKIQEEYGRKAFEKLQIEVFIEGTLFINQALRKATGITEDFGLEKNVENNNGEAENNLLKSDNLVAPANAHERNEMAKLLSYEWRGALMISILAKIGLDKPNIEYLPFLKEVLSYPESVGIIAGKPGFAYFVVGHVDDYLVYLDPHFVQDAVPLEKGDIEKHRGTYTCSQARYINYSDIDTSVAINFLIRDRQHFQDFIERFRKSCKHPDSFLGVEVAAPRDDVSDFESVGDDDEFVRCGEDDDDDHVEY